ncbi:hypothetical protein COW46_01420 [Candidatus Gracilibacteria bacterium CG17_big_fil_post_rev_8_21_14_2_50_48_13]|nr:MAG: hypothetical protein COW46_01420 [Candidatus Gracilibacteria bacterium CG17_big_fil_post_rev_8_21_14_2_50_48_13]
MNEKQDPIIGTWWISDKPENKVPGSLEVDEKKLTLLGAFNSFPSSALMVSILETPVKENMIVGISSKGEYFSLEYYKTPAHTQLAFSRSLSHNETYSIYRIIKGGHFDNIDELSFDHIRVELPHLFQWFSKSAVKSEILSKEEKGLDTISITCDLNNPERTVLYSDELIEVSYNIDLTVPTLPLDDLHISQKGIVKIESKIKSMQLDSLLSILNSLIRFLQIGIGQKLKPIKITAHIDKNNVQVLLPPNLITIKKRSIHDMMFSFSEVEGSIQDILHKVINYNHDYADILNLYSGLIEDSTKNIHNRFKDAVSFIEGFVKQKSGDKTLEQVFKLFNKEYTNSKGDTLLPAADVKKIIVTRDRLTHFFMHEKKLKHVVDEECIIIYTDKLIFLIEFALLKDLGLHDDLLEKFYEKRSKSVLY